MTQRTPTLSRRSSNQDLQPEDTSSSTENSPALNNSLIEASLRGLVQENQVQASMDLLAQDTPPVVNPPPVGNPPQMQNPAYLNNQPPVVNPPPVGNPPQMQNPAYLNNQPPYANWQALQAIFNTVAIPARPLPEYHGRDYEDPVIFVTQMEQYFQIQGVPAEQRINLTSQALKDGAENWWDIYRGLPYEWARFRELFLQKFNSATIIGRLTSQLYSQKQGDKEPVCLFLQKKYLLFQRLQPHAPVETRVATLLELLRPSIQRGIRASHPADFDTLMTRAVEAEFDESEATPYPKKVERPLEASGPPPSRKLPQCWHCPEKHFNRDCPVKKLRKYPRKQRKPTRKTGGEGATRADRPPIKLQTTKRRFRFVPHFQITLNNQELWALFDSASTDNFVQPQYLTQNQRDQITPCLERVDVAKAGESLKILGTLELSFQMNGHPMKSVFFVSDESNDPFILGDKWIEEENAIYVRSLKHIYVGTTERFTIYCGNTPPSHLTDDSEIVKALSEVPPKYFPMFRDALQRFQPIVNPTGCPTQTRSTEYQIELTNTQPF